MSEIISTDKMSEMNKAAVLCKYVYDNDQEEAYERGNKSIADIIDESKSYDNAIGNDDLLKKAAEANGVDDFELIKQSRYTISVETKDGLVMEEVIACAFKDPDTGDIYIVYRGTGDGKWVDNGDAFSKYNSLMQQRAREFFDSVIESTDSQTIKTGKIIVTGHSKGGNLAQFSMMDSKYGDLVDECYSFNGQGFSQKAIDGFKERWGEDYQKQIDKMYSVNGNNDYVHDLGIPIIRGDRTYFIPTSGSGFASWHMIEEFFDENGNLRWELDENGVSITQQGPVGQLAKKVSAEMMKLDEESLDDCAVTIMFLLELFLGDDITGGNSKIGTGARKYASFEDIHGFLTTGVPLLIKILSDSDRELIGILKLLDEEGKYTELLDEVLAFAQERDINLIPYILEDPMRLLEIYSSLNVGKQTIHESLASLFSIKNIASVVAILKLTGLDCAVTVAVSSAIVSIVAKHIYVRFKEIANEVQEILKRIGAEVVGAIDDYLSSRFEFYDDVKGAVKEVAALVDDKVSKLYGEIKAAVNDGINFVTDSILGFADEIISRSIHVAVEAYKDLKSVWDNRYEVIKRCLKVANPVLYSIASRIFGLNSVKLRIDLGKIKNDVNTLYNLARRIAYLDTRLDNLYYKLSKNNIEQSEGVFTSLARIYNLFRADLNIDGGAKIKKRANELNELLKGFENLEKKLIDNVPKKI